MKRVSSKLAVVWFACASGTAAQSQSAAAPSRPDIAGVRLGMTPEQTRAAITAYDSLMRVSVKRATLRALPDSSYIGQMLARSDAPQGGTDVVRADFAGPPHPTGAVMVSRQATYPTGSQPTVAAYREALEAKYGKPTVTREEATGQVDMAWLYTSAGEKRSEAPPLRQCRWGRLPGSPPQDAGLGDFYQLPLDNNGCGFMLWVQVVPDYQSVPGGVKKGLLVRDILSGMVDQDSLSRLKVATETYLTERKLNRASAVKPRP